ncbi:MAG: 3-phosphoshikimate 1-carboxyvinyltransferase [Spirochaetes bacterium]|nr:3-phosphoshikimate 1-carboxyvinyltransferase [Spirochaetota bacterium]
MKFAVKPSKIGGRINIPGSKSHTIRALVAGLLAEGESFIRLPLESADTYSCFNMIKKFGAGIQTEEKLWKITGTGGDISIPEDVIDAGNSGTTLYFGLGIASLADGYTVFTGDNQLRNRPADALIKSINDLGGIAYSTRGNNKPPVVVKGRIKGGKTGIEAVTSQYLSSLLLSCPLAQGDTEIILPLLNEKPYVEMTLNWMSKAGLEYHTDDFKKFMIRGGQRYKPVDEYIPADFSSATFFLAAAAITGQELTLNGLDFKDKQGDKEVVNILKKMGCDAVIEERQITIKGSKLAGGIFDLNAIPDSLPALAVTACFAEGETRLVNVAQARVKETDRIKVMSTELKKMGADIEELPDGLIIRRSDLKGAAVNGHADHRIVMALAVAGVMADGQTEIDTAEAVSITFPDFYDLMKQINANIQKLEEK